MKIVIDIPEERYKDIQRIAWVQLEYHHFKTAEQIIANGTPLPKGHGKIGDLDAVMSDISTSINGMTNIGMIVDGEWLWGKLNDAIYNAPTIIEADTESENKA